MIGLIYGALATGVLGYLFLLWIYSKRYAGPKADGKAIIPPPGKWDADVIVVGSGVLGSSLAVTLARDGRKVKVIERDLSRPERIIGELLQPGGVNALIKLGLQDCLEDIDYHKVAGYVIHDLSTDSKVHVPYPGFSEEEGSQVVKTNEPAVGSATAFRYGYFVQSLRAAAQSHENIEYIEASATKILEQEGVVVGVQYEPKDSPSSQVFAPLTVVADGHFSRFRKTYHDGAKQKETKSHFVGLLMHNCPQSRANHAELILADPNPILVYQTSSTTTRILVDIRGPLPKDMKMHLTENILPQLPIHLQEPFLDALCNGSIHSMPNRILPASVGAKPGILVLGDALNMRHPLTGGGMSVALNDIVIWRDLLHNMDLQDFRTYDILMSAWSTFLRQRSSKHSFVVNVLSGALYELFSSPDEHLKALKFACIEYFKLGGQCVTGPVGLLSVLDPKPSLLIKHFFAVALYAIYFSVKKEGWAVHKAVINSSMILYKACWVLFPLVLAE